MARALLTERAVRRPVARRGHWGRRLVLVVVVVALLIPAVTAARVWYFARQDQRRSADAILVLGAAQFDGRPSEVFEARLRHAQALYLAGLAPRIVTVGGGRAGDRLTEAQAGRQWLVGKGIPASAVVAVPRGRNTLASVQAAQTVFVQQGWGSALVVTDPWHALRSTTMAGDAGITAYSSPTRSGPSVRDRGTELRYVVRETAGLLYYRVTGGSPAGSPPAV